MAETTTPDLSHAYDAICTSYHALEDARGRWLGLLPLASGAGIFYLIANTPSAFFPAIGIVGVLITFGLYCYELRALQMTKMLVLAGAEIERTFWEGKGQFSWRLSLSQTFFHRIVLGNHLGSAIIYASVAAGWYYLAVAFLSLSVATSGQSGSGGGSWVNWTTLAVGIGIALLGSLVSMLWERNMSSAQKKRQEALLSMPGVAL